MRVKNHKHSELEHIYTLCPFTGLRVFFTYVFKRREGAKQEDHIKLAEEKGEMREDPNPAEAFSPFSLHLHYSIKTNQAPKSKQTSNIIKLR
ncbi:hypothetical protein EDM58_04780 [Brevibacillus panacihumi]|uniref:Uncharacterized protein n=1 Tax=Brevibacillus panacihumi TaxID=497735 RepID=A0A3M8DBR6_9BACL|nr:hypothetical protein EDM58_04780 [Brevibacillus panacihumi]